MNGALRRALGNPPLASTVSFLPLPTASGVSGMSSWAPLGGLVGSLAVVRGLLFVDKIDAGPFAGLTITANILMSLLIDKFGLFGMEVHQLNIWRTIGGALMVAGVALIAIF